MKKYVVSAASILLMVFVYFYFTLGGFNEPELSVTDASQVFIMGKSYNGKLNDKKFAELFDEADAYIESNQLKSSSCAVYYNDAQKGNDVAEVFVGILVDSLTVIPDGYKLVKLEGRKVVQARVMSHFTVAPINIYERIAEFSKAQNLNNLKVPTLEIYPSADEVIIQVPVENLK
jgi:hypothetical protein